jgi:hypothetical protein
LALQPFCFTTDFGSHQILFQMPEKSSLPSEKFLLPISDLRTEDVQVVAVAAAGEPTAM